MQDEIQQSLKDVIKKNLPQQVGESLQEELKKIQVMKKELEERDVEINLLKEKVKVLVEKMSQYQSEVNNLKGKLMEHEDLDNRFHNIKNREMEAEVRDLRVQIQANKEKEGVAMDCLKVIFGNNRLKTSVIENIQDHYQVNYDGNGNPIHNKTGHSKDTTTIVEDKPSHETQY